MKYLNDNRPLSSSRERKSTTHPYVFPDNMRVISPSFSPSTSDLPPLLFISLHNSIRTTSSEKPAVIFIYVAMLSIFIALCVTCGVVRNRRRDARERRALTQRRLAILADTTVSPSQIARVSPIVTVQVDEEQLNGPCPICLETLSKQSVTAGHCGHPLHTVCLNQWLVRDPYLSCPVCRAAYTRCTEIKPRSRHYCQAPAAYESDSESDNDSRATTRLSSLENVDATQSDFDPSTAHGSDSLLIQQHAQLGSDNAEAHDVTSSHVSSDRPVAERTASATPLALTVSNLPV